MGLYHDGHSNENGVLLRNRQIHGHTILPSSENMFVAITIEPLAMYCQYIPATQRTKSLYYQTFKQQLVCT